MSGTNNQFYKDNAPNYDEFKVLTSLFKGLTDIFDEVMSQAIDNSKISTMRAFTTIPIQIINVVDACYSLPTLLTNKEVLNITGINPELNVYERMEVWNSLDPKIRATALEQMGLVLMLINPNILKGENAYTDTFKVVDFEMYDYNTGDRLIYGLDYYYEYNKIYFLRFGSHTNKYNNKKIILKNITIDNNTPEKILGESLGIYANSNFSPTEYRDVITSFAGAALAGPVISTMNQSFNPDTTLNLAARTYGLNDDENSLKGIRVVDYKSADDIRKNFWDKQVEGIDKLTIFDFLVTIPSEYLYKTEKMEYVYEFMKKIKPAQSNFVLCPEYILADGLFLRYSNFSFKSEGEMTGIKDNIRYDESMLYPASHKKHDKLNVTGENTTKRSNHTTHDYLDVVNMTHGFFHLPEFTPKDNIAYQESDYRIVYLEHITRIQSNRTQYLISDDVALDTDYFDAMLMSDEFIALTSYEAYDVAPKFKMVNLKKISSILQDKGSLKDDTQQKFMVALTEKVGNITGLNNTPLYPTDIGFMLDILHFNDVVVNHKADSLIAEKIKSTEHTTKFVESADIIEHINGVEKNCRVVYLEHLTKVYVSRQTLHISDDMQLDTDYFDTILLGDTFAANMEIATYDKAPKIETVDFAISRLEQIKECITSKEAAKWETKHNLKDSIKSKEHKTVNDVKETVRDNIKYKDSAKSILLNGDSLCDKISSIDNPKGSNTANIKDTLSFASRANIAKCDSIYCCDYEAETNFKLDNEGDFHAKHNSIGYEVISLKLIPKK